MKITKHRLKEIIKEELSRMKEGGLAGHYTEPRHEGGTPQERLINKLLIRSQIEKAGGDPERAAEMLGLGDDEEVIAYLANLMGNPMLANPNMEEGFGWRDDDDDTPPGYPMTNKQKRAEIGMPEEEPLHLSRPKHDPLDRSPAGIRARRRLQGKGIKNYPLDK